MASKDKVLHPSTTMNRESGSPKQVKSAIIEGPTCTEENKTAYNRKSSK